FAARERLGELKRRADLFEETFSLAVPVRIEHELEPRRGRVAVTGASLQIEEGTHTIVEGSPRALELVAKLDGSARLGDVLQASADRLRLSESEMSQLRRDLLDLVRELLELGALRFH